MGVNGCGGGGGGGGGRDGAKCGYYLVLTLLPDITSFERDGLGQN